MHWIAPSGKDSAADTLVKRLYHSEEVEAKLKGVFSEEPKYADVAGFCKVATHKGIEARGWSLNPWRSAGAAPGETASDEDFKEQLGRVNKELESLNAKAQGLKDSIAKNVADIF